jgi:hypothetical protein
MASGFVDADGDLPAAGSYLNEDNGGFEAGGASGPTGPGIPEALGQLWRMACVARGDGSAPVPPLPLHTLISVARARLHHNNISGALAAWPKVSYFSIV